MAQNVIRKTLYESHSVIRWVAGLGDRLWLSLVAGWISVFDELVLLDDMNVYYLGQKYPEERSEAEEAWMKYVLAFGLFPDAKHQLNSMWLHAIDETADLLNTHAAMMLNKLRGTQAWEKGMTRDILERSVAIAVMVVETRTGILNEDARFQLCRAVLSMATSKMLMTPIRPHASGCLVSWGEFPMGQARV